MVPHTITAERQASEEFAVESSQSEVRQFLGGIDASQGVVNEGDARAG